MSTRIHFRGNNLNKLENQIEELTGFMRYDDNNNEVTTFTKLGNESFYEKGSKLLRGITDEYLKGSHEIVRYFSNNDPFYAKVYKPENIIEYLNRHVDKIDKINNINDEYEELLAAKHLIKVYQFAVNNDLEIWCY